jgi:uncharacterized membrane-anchored protein YitT (DUF2179 family)
MWIVGVLLVTGSGLSFIGTTFFGFDNWAGVSAGAAGVAFGAGIMIAGFDPVANVSWVRAVIIYAILNIIWQIFSAISVGKFDIFSFVIAIVVAVLILVLYPNKPALWMQGGSGMGARA